MIIFTTIVEINGKSPDQIYDWVLNLNNDKYKRWHPGFLRRSTWCIYTNTYPTHLSKRQPDG